MTRCLWLEESMVRDPDAALEERHGACSGHVEEGMHTSIINVKAAVTAVMVQFLQL